MAAPKIRLTVTPQGYGSHVFIDDREVDGLSGVRLEVGLDGSHVVLTFAPTAVEVEGEAGRITRGGIKVGFWRGWWAWIWRGELVETTHLQSWATERRKP